MKRAPISILVMSMVAASQAAIITQWNFNSTVPDANTATGVTTPSTGSGSASLLSPVTGAFSSGDANGGSSDPATGDDSGWQTTTYAAQGVGSGTAGIRFNVSTVGFNNIVVKFDTRHSNTSSRWIELQYTLDGTNWLSNGYTFQGTAGDTWFNNRTADLSTIAGASNNANFGVKMVTIFAPSTSTYISSSAGTSAAYATAGTLRYDMVTVSGSAVPEPASMAILGLGIAGIVAKRRRK